MQTFLAHQYWRWEAGARWLHHACGQPFRWLLTGTLLGQWIRLYTSPNLWSWLRLPLAMIIGQLLSRQEDRWAIGVFCLALATDRLDGELARLEGATSAAGAKLDTFVDGTMVIAVLLGLGSRLPRLVTGPSGWHIGHVVIALEIPRLIGGYLLSTWSQSDNQRLALGPNLSGKYKMAAVGLGVLLALSGHGALAVNAFTVAIVISLYSMLRHLYDWSVARSSP